MTMEQLAEAVGVSKSYIWALENNPEQRVQRTSATVMNNLAKALGVNLLDLMGEAPPEALGDERQPGRHHVLSELHGPGGRGQGNLPADAGAFPEAEGQVSQSTKKRDTAGAKAAIKVARWIEPWGEARFPVDVDMLAKGCHTMYGRDDPITQVHGAPWKGIDGFLRRNPDNAKEWWITYSTNVGPERQRFTKAHELGHYILHSQQKTEFRCGPDVIIEKDTGEPNIEAQANQFASYLLMPANHVRPRIEKATITLDLISELAEKTYGVSLEAMCIRFVEITGERAVLVYWDNGMMRRWSRSEPAKLQRLWLDAPRGCPVEQFVAPWLRIRWCASARRGNSCRRSYGSGTRLTARCCAK
jgi:DNA-binding XRE family transcriptional regulator